LKPNARSAPQQNWRLSICPPDQTWAINQSHLSPITAMPPLVEPMRRKCSCLPLRRHRENTQAQAEQTKEAGFQRHVQVAPSIQCQKKNSRCCGILWYQTLNDEYSIGRRRRNRMVTAADPNPNLKLPRRGTQRTHNGGGQGRVMVMDNGI